MNFAGKSGILTIHGLLVDDMMYIYSCDATRMKDELLALYKKDLEITRGSKMETFLGLELGSGAKRQINQDSS